MSTRTKIVLALIVLVVLYWMYDSYKKRKAAEEAAKIPACKDISTVKWTTDKRTLAQEIYQNQFMKYFMSSSADRSDFFDAYKDAAIESGIASSNPNYSRQVLQYGSEQEAHKEMLKQGYCEKDVTINYGWS